MSLTLILGPMKSGKSLELIGRFLPLKYTNKKIALYQPLKNVRDEKISSRNNLSIDAKKIKSLNEIDDYNIEFLGIDEIHMFDKSDAKIIKKFLDNNVEVFICGLDLDYKGKIFDVIKKILELGPKKIYYKRSVCEICKEYKATHTQILKNNKPMLSGLPSCLPDDGTYKYIPVCRDCFICE